MAETVEVNRKARLERRIQEARASWEISSRRIEAVKHDLALALDGQRHVVLQEQLADLEREREALESELERLEGELEAERESLSAVAFSQIEFVNRENELRLLDMDRMRKTRSPYTLIGAPAGYGKSYLLRRLVSSAQADEAICDQWAFCYLDFDHAGQDQIAFIARSIARVGAVQDRADVDQICDSVVGELAAPLPEGRKAVLLILDGVERLNTDARQWLYTLFLTLNQRTRMGYQEIIVVRIIVAGRHPEQFWEGYERAFAPALAPQRLYLSPFDQHPIQELVWSQAQAVQISLDDQMVVQLADEVQYLSGGHPKVIRSLVDHLTTRSFAIGSPVDYFARRRAELIHSYVSPVVADLVSGFDDELAEIVQTLSVFRRINANTVQVLVQAGELPANINEIEFLSRIQKTSVLVGPTIQEPFYRDMLMRRVLAIHMAYGTKASADRYQRLNGVALELYDNWILNLGKALPDSFLKSTQRLLSVVEWLFHALQNPSQDEGMLYDGLTKYAQALSSGTLPLSVADLIIDQIRQDVEVRYLLSHQMGDGAIDTVYKWLQSCC
ncbi:MAG: ATP-binding protein [Anaerolineae bacterium]|nr:ATP-binding protein [Anaerolineae bacterium]